MPRSASSATASSFSCSAFSAATSARSATIFSFIARSRSVCWSEACLIARTDAGLELGQRVALVAGGELLGERLAVPAQQVVDERLDAVLDCARRLVAEMLLEQPRHDAGLGPERRLDALRQLGADGAGALGELRLDLARLALELGLDVFGVGRRLLAVEARGRRSRSPA